MATTIFRRLVAGALVMAVLALALVVGAGSAAADGNAGAVYTLSNATAANGGNAVLVFDRAADGTLTAAGSYGTGGNGTGAGLGSQGAVVLSEDGTWLFAVNAGSNSVSVFRVRPNGLSLVDRQPSGGMMPISVTSRGSLLYVLNAGDASNTGANITGFRVNWTGRLLPIDGSTQPLSQASGTGPAQVSFSPDGNTLVVTEKATNKIDTYKVGWNGAAGAPTVHASAGATPFGFDFGKRGALVVSEAFGGAPTASALSSYRVSDDGFNVVSASVHTTQTAACWVVVTGNGKYAYTTNAGSDSISSYNVNNDDSLTLLKSVAGSTGAGSHPTDMALSHNSQYLYALNAFTHTMSGFSVQADGSLAPVMSMNGMPEFSVGLAAR
ncbi:MAG: beta-propeller fold lactonase family protein [Anaerolineae bacterium]